MTEWESAQKWESEWWGDACNTFTEEEKQKTYMAKMGMPYFGMAGREPVWDFAGKTVLDVGGGPCSVLLKGVNIGTGVVIDPCPYPDWVTMRYAIKGIVLRRQKGEDIYDPPGSFDVGLLYNCLQHTEDPEKILYNMRRCCRMIRIFEWVNIGVSPGHLQVLNEEDMNKWMGGRGFVEALPQYGTTAYHGVFVGG